MVAQAPSMSVPLSTFLSFPALVLSQPSPVLPPVPPVAEEGVHGRDRDVGHPLNCSIVLKIKARYLNVTLMLMNSVSLPSCIFQHPLPEC